MDRKAIYSIAILVCTALLLGCYCGTVDPNDSSWNNTDSQLLDDEFAVTVTTAGGNNTAYRGEELLISISPKDPAEEYTIALANDSNEITVLAENYSGPFPFSWLIPSDFPQGECYRVMVAEPDFYKDFEGSGYSEEFAIIEQSYSGLSDITVSSRTIVISLTDNGSVIDDDTVTIRLNGSILLSDHILQGPPGTSITLNLLQGINSLSITAVNEGGVSPNTAEIAFTDVVAGEAVQQWRLNTGETGSLSISAP